MNTITINHTGVVFAWNTATHTWESRGYYIAAQRVNVGTEHETVNLDLYSVNGQFIKPLPYSSVTLGE